METATCGCIYSCHVLSKLFSVFSHSLWMDGWRLFSRNASRSLRSNSLRGCLGTTINFLEGRAEAQEVAQWTLTSL